MTDTISEKDANKLLNQISRAMTSGDGDKLDALMTQEEPQLPDEEENEEVESPDETPVEVPEDEEEDSGENADDPQDKETPADQPDEEVKEQPTAELVKLKEQLDALTSENHKLRSQAGRVPHVQRRIQELDKKLAELEKKPAPSSQPSEAITTALKGLKETDPELADMLSKAIEAATSGVNEQLRNKEVETLNLLREQELVTQQDAEVQRLLEMCPNAPEVFESKTFKDWKKEQSPGMRAMADSEFADDVIQAIEKYGQDMIKKYPELAGKQEEAPKAPAPVAVNEEAKKIEQQRERKKQTAAVVSTPSASGKVNMPDDPNAVFEKFFAQISKERSGA